MANKFMRGPIPGQSLTDAPGSSMAKKPPMFVHEPDALNFMWNKVLSNPKTVTQIMTFLKAGLTVIEITNTLLYAGCASSKWTLDLAFLMYQEVAWQIEALAKIRKIRYTFKPIDETYNQFLIQYQDYIKEPEETPVEKAASAIFSGLKV